MSALSSGRWDFADCTQANNPQCHAVDIILQPQSIPIPPRPHIPIRRIQPLNRIQNHCNGPLRRRHSHRVRRISNPSPPPRKILHINRIIARTDFTKTLYPQWPKYLFVNWVQGLGFREDEDEGEGFGGERRDFGNDVGSGEGFGGEVGY